MGNIYKKLIVIAIIASLTGICNAQDWDWVKKIGGTGTPTPIDIAAGSGGSVYIIGTFTGSIDFGTTNLISKGSNDIYLAKYNASTVVWAKSFGTTASDQAGGVAVDGSDNVYITGNFSNTINFGSGDLTSAGAYDVFVAKFNSSGNVQWSRRGGGTNSDYGRDIAVDGSGNVYITGDYDGGSAAFGSFSLGSFAFNDAFVVKYNTSGTEQWATKMGNTGTDYGYGIATDGTGVYITGQFSATSTTFYYGGESTTINNSGYYLARLKASNGEGEWALGGGGALAGRYVRVSGSNIFTTGLIASSVSANFTGTNLTSAGSNDIYLVRTSTGGTHQSQARLGGANEENVKGLALDATGNPHVMGSYTGNTVLGSNNFTAQGLRDIFLLKADVNCNVTWARSDGGVNDDIPAGLVIKSSGVPVGIGKFNLETKFGGSTYKANAPTGFNATYNATGTLVTQFLSYANNAYDDVLGVDIDALGNVYVAGTFNGYCNFGGTYLTSSGGSDVFVAKYDASGNLLWVRGGGGSGTDQVNDIQVTSNGVFVTGQIDAGTATFGATNLTSAGSFDILVLKYDLSGNLIWAKNIGGTSNDVGNGIAESGGKIYIAGQFIGTVNFGGGNITSLGGTDVFLLSLNSDNSYSWVQTGGSTGNDAGLDVAITPSRVIIGGYIGANATFGTATLTSKGSFDALLIGYDLTGALKWGRNDGGSGSEQFTGLALTNNSRLVATGYFAGTATLGGQSLTASGSYDGFVASYQESDGVPITGRKEGGTSADYIYDVDADAYGNVYVVGNFALTANLGGINLTSTGAANVFVCRYNTDLVPKRSEKASGLGSDRGNGVAIDLMGNAYVVGRINDQTDFGSSSITNGGGIDGFVAKFKCPTPTITSQPTNQAVCAGGDATFTVAATGTGLSYQWKKNGTIDVGTNSPNLVLVGVTAGDAGNYSCVISSGCNAVTSNVATLTVNPVTAISTNPIGGTYCDGDLLTLTVAASGTGPFSYQWKKGAANVGSNSNTFSIGSLTTGDAGNYSCVVTGLCGNATSTSATVNVNPTTAITTNPLSTNKCLGENATFNVTASGAGLSYQWKKGAANVGTNSATLNINGITLADAGGYTCEVTGTCGSVISGSALLAINPDPVITSPAVDTTLGEGTSFCFRSDVMGNWYVYNHAVPTQVSTNKDSLKIAIIWRGGSDSIEVLNALGCKARRRITVTSAPRVAAIVWLEGAYNPATDQHQGIMATGGYLDPYKAFDATALYNSTNTAIPNYKSRITLGSIGDSLIDVVKVHLLDGSFATVASGYAWVHADGRLRDYATASHPHVFVEGNTFAPGNYYVKIEHRNHLSVVSNGMVMVDATNRPPVDFGMMTNIYGGGAIKIDNSPVRYGLISGDYNHDQEVNANDLYRLRFDEINLNSGYIGTDANFDGVVNGLDYNIISANNDNLYFSTAP